MNGEVYLAEDARGWLAIHESESGDSSGMEGPFPSYPRAERAAKDCGSACKKNPVMGVIGV